MNERAFTCWVPCLDGDPVVHCGIYRATSASKARYKCFLSVGDSYDDITFADIRVLRAPSFDSRGFREGVMPEFIEREERARAGGVR